MSVDDKLNPFRLQQIKSSLYGFFVKLHIGDTVHEQTADTIVAFKNGDAMARLI